MYFEKLLFLISMLQLSKGAIERDLLLTRKENLQINGRTLFYNPSSYETNGTEPWEETLKHLTFITLFTETGRGANLSELREYRDFMHAPYVRSHEDYSRFGDIITMARGWLENADGYTFREGLCEEVCLEKALAIWRVQKIRHRDSLRGFRFEMKFSITALDNKDQLQIAPNINERYIKSFILKDDEYPKSFNILTRRSDSIEDFSNERQARIVNHGSKQDFTHIPQLNIGEFLKQVPKASSKVGYIPSSRNDLPTTYRPNYHMRYTKPVYEAPEDPKTVVTHHYHHHYFMNDAESSTLRDDKVYHHGIPDAIRIIKPPTVVDYLQNRYVLTTTTTEAPPTQSGFYMPQRPWYAQQSFAQVKTTTPPFRQSEQQFEEVRYSEPDPLYENLDGLPKESSNNPMHSEESSSLRIHLQVERPSPEALNIMIEQLPQSAEYQDTHILNIDKKQDTTSTTIKPTTLLYQSTRRTLLPKSKLFITLPSVTTSTSPTTLSDNLIRHVSKFSPRDRNNIRTTTEQPILKWKAKRKPKQSKETTESSVEFQTNTEEKIITVTPNKVELEVSTQKSISKSISVKVGNHSKEIPLIIESTAMFNDPEGTSDMETNENES